MLFFNWHFVDFFDNPPARRRELFLRCRIGGNYTSVLVFYSCLTFVVSAYYSNTVLFGSDNNLLFGVAVAEH